MNSHKVVVFLCSGASKSSSQKLSFRIANYIEDMGIAEIGSLAMLSEMRLIKDKIHLRKMIFINDCNSSCVKLLMHSFDPSDYLYIDVVPYKHLPEFDIQQFVEGEIIPKIAELYKNPEKITSPC